MSQYHPAQIWYATDSRAGSPFKVLVFDDKGSLTVRDGKVSFEGRRHSFTIGDIEDVVLARQMPNWPWHLAAAAVLLALLMSRGTPLIVAVPVIACAAVLAMSIGLATKWVKVTHRSDGGQMWSAWFADGSNLGWSGVFGGTRQLFDTVRAALLATDGSAEEAVVLGAAPNMSSEPVEEACPWCEKLVIVDEDGACPACNRPI